MLCLAVGASAYPLRAGERTGGCSHPRYGGCQCQYKRGRCL